MARLSFTFGEVSPASSIGKVKAVSVLKLPRTLETSTQSSLGKVKAVSVLKLPSTQLVSTLTGKVTTFPVLKSSRTLEAPTQSSLGKVKASATLKSPQNNQLKNTENINKSKFSVRSDTIDAELLSSTINKRLIIAKSLAYNITPNVVNKGIVVKGFTNNILQVKDVNSINKSKFNASGDTIDTELLSSTINKRLIVAKSLAYNITPSVINKPIVSIKDASKPLTYSTLNKGLVVKGFSNKFNLENITKSKFIVGSDNNRISTNIIAKYTATQIYELKFNTSVNNVAKFKVLGTYGEKNNKLKPENLSLYSPIDNLNVLENSIEIISLSSDSTSKTLFFQNQTVQKFFAGDIVKIKNSSTSYIDYVTVNSANNNSITYTSSNISPTVSGTFIESGTTVYSKLLSTTVGPYPLRNFNISYSTPGKKSNKSLGFGNQSAASSDQAVGVKKAPIQFWS